MNSNYQRNLLKLKVKKPQKLQAFHQRLQNIKINKTNSIVSLDVKELYLSKPVKEVYIKIGTTQLFSIYGCPCHKNIKLVSTHSIQKNNAYQQIPHCQMTPPSITCPSSRQFSHIQILQTRRPQYKTKRNENRNRRI